MDWFRWHHGTVSDPKLKLIAQKSGRPLTTVIAVWAAMEERASENDPRGALDGWDPEVMAAGLDIQTADVLAIHDAMQTRTLEGDELRAWRKRQPRREDDSTERVRAHRAKKEPGAVDETQRNAEKRNVTLDKSRVEESREVKKKPPSSVSKKAAWKFCPDDFQPDEKHRLLARQLTVNLDVELAKFRDHEYAKPKSDPGRAFSTWLRNASEFKRNGNGSYGSSDPWAIKPGELDQ